MLPVGSSKQRRRQFECQRGFDLQGDGEQVLIGMVAADELRAALLKKAGFTRKNGMTGAVTLIQRFGSALNLNVHFHMLVVDGAYSRNQYGKVVFKRTKAPEKDELCKLVNKISLRVAAYLEREGFLERGEENSFLQLDGMEEDPMQQLPGHSITYRVAVGPQQGNKVFTRQTVPATETDGNSQVAQESGFSLHAGVVAQHWERKKLERLCRYITRPAISDKRLSITAADNVRYQLKTPYRDGTTGRHSDMWYSRSIFWPGLQRWYQSRE